MEGSPISFSSEGSYDPDGTIKAYLWNFGDGEQSTEANPTHTYKDNGEYMVILTITDNNGAENTDTTTAIITNVAPRVDEITILPDTVEVGLEIKARASFTDPGGLDTHTAVWSWDDGTTPGIVTESDGSGSVTGSHVYTNAGVYTITLTVTDDDGGVGTATFEYVVVYDPSAGFVTGGGWIWSPIGAYVADPDLKGKATFSFVSKYEKGTTVPTGNTEFQFHAAGMNFKSTSYDWLVVAGNKAVFKGTGTINGGGSYGFLLSAIDGGTKGVDKFRIKIWDIKTGDLVYDNQNGVPDTADPTENSCGSIVIHK